MKKLTYIAADDHVEFVSDINAGLFLDFNKFNPHYISGVFDERTSYGIDGSQIYSRTISKRQVKFTAKFLSYNVGNKHLPIEIADENMINRLNRMFNPKFEGKLIYFDGSNTWFLNCISNSIPVYGEWDGLTRDITFDLFAPYPYWQSENQTVINIGSGDPLLSFPVSFPVQLGEITSLSQDIVNPCQDEIYPIVRIFPCNSAPVIKNLTTGKAISLNTGVSDGFYIDVDTNPANMTVDLYNDSGLVANVTYWLSLTSDYDFSILPGLNSFVVENIVAGAYPTASIMFREVML